MRGLKGVINIYFLHYLFRFHTNSKMRFICSRSKIISHPDIVDPTYNYVFTPIGIQIGNWGQLTFKNRLGVINVQFPL